MRFIDHTQRRSTVGRTPLVEWPARRRDLYLTTHNTHNRQTSIPPVGFEPPTPACERPQIYALDRAATGSGRLDVKHRKCGPLGRSHAPHITFAGRKNVWSAGIGKSILVSREVVGKKLLLPLDRTIQETSF